jgi:SAM-dependent methyltransferase
MRPNEDNGTVCISDPCVNTYDQVPYPGGARAAAQCQRLETIATLFGLMPVPSAGARVLELGCGSGENLAAQALAYPGAHFVGCDASEAAIMAARELARSLLLVNVELRNQDLCDIDSSWGQFDYIVCHGVFSWVGPNVRRRILEILRYNLATNGVGFVSYNALPGWHLRRVVRELMRHHTRGIEGPTQIIEQARAVLALAVQAYTGADPYAELLRDEYLHLSRSSDGYLYHEMLEEHNEPFYLHEFIEQIEAAGLQYLGAADFPEMFCWDMPAEVRASLEDLPLPIREQYLDRLRGCTFKSSLVCHAKAVVDRSPAPQVLERFTVRLAADSRIEISASGAQPTGVCNSNEGPSARLTFGFAELACTDPLALSALRYLEQRRPEAVAVQLLCEVASGGAGKSEDSAVMTLLPAANVPDGTEGFLRFLMNAVQAGAVQVTLSREMVSSRISERPAVSPLVRWKPGAMGR